MLSLTLRSEALGDFLKVSKGQCFLFCKRDLLIIPTSFGFFFPTNIFVHPQF